MYNQNVRSRVSGNEKKRGRERRKEGPAGSTKIRQVLVISNTGGMESWLKR